MPYRLLCNNIGQLNDTTDEPWIIPAPIVVSVLQMRKRLQPWWMKSIDT